MSAKRMKQLLFHVLETILYVSCYSVLLNYFDVIPYILSIDSDFKGIWMFLSAFFIYLFNYFRFIIHPKASLKITQDRWYVVSPISVWLIFSCYFLSSFYFIVDLWSKYNFVSVIIVSVGCVLIFKLLELLEAIKKCYY